MDDARGQKDDRSVYFVVGGGQDDGEVSVVSRDAYLLHYAAISSSVTAGEPGFVADEQLTTLRDDAEQGAAELCRAGLWSRDDSRGGYALLDPVVTDIAASHETLERNQVFCEITGGHSTTPELGPKICSKCMLPIAPTYTDVRRGPR